MTETLNIVELIENNPLAKITNNNNVNILTKIQTCFTGFEEQLFISSFYCYLNYDRTKDYKVDWLI